MMVVMIVRDNGGNGGKVMAEVMVMMVIINMMEIEGVRTFLQSLD